MNVKAYDGNEKYAFISYSHKDKEIVNTVLERLCFLGIRFWYDDGIHSEQWIDRLVQKIASCEVMIVFLSENYYLSRDCNKELTLAYENNKQFFIIKTDDSNATGKSAYILSGLNYVEYPSKTLDELLERIEIEEWARECRSLKRDPIVLKHGHSLDLNNLYYNGPNIGDEEISNTAWGPEREMHPEENRPDFVSLNSAFSSEYGDERFFVDIREQGTRDYCKEVILETGKTYEVRILYHNNASDESNKTGFGVATNLRAAVLLPIIVFPGESRLLIAALQASMIDKVNAVGELKNAKVWSSVKLIAKHSPALIQFKNASATIENKGAANGSILPSHLFSEAGTPLGYNKLVGTIPGGKQYAGYVHFKFQVF